MSEGTHSTTTKRKISPWATIVGGSVVAVAGAAVMFQVFNAEPAAATNEQAGKVSLNEQSQAPPLARVNGQVITYDVVARECFDRLGEEVLENLINRTIIFQEVQKRGLAVTEAELNEEVKKIAGRFNLPPDTWYQMLQTERGLSPLQYRRDVVWPMIALRKLAGEEVKITEADMQKAFARDYGPRVRCRMIVMDNIRRANEVWEKANREPEEFEKLAREFSTAPNSRSLGGSIPPISRHSGNQILEDAAFRLRPGEISGLIQVDNSHVILKCEGHTEQIVTNIEDVRAELAAQLIEEKTQERVSAVFDDLKKKTRIDNYLTNTSTGTASGATSSVTTPGQIQQTGSVAPTGRTGNIAPASGATTR